MPRVVITGAAGAVGRRVATLAAADPDIDDVVAIDRISAEGGGPRVIRRRARLVEADLPALFEGAGAVCHLAAADPLEPADPAGDLDKLDAVLRAVVAARVGHLVVRTSASVYGASPDNPVPLTESAPVRPDVDAAWVRSRALIEQRVEQFRAEHDATTVAVLRPCVTVSERGPDGLGRILSASRVVAGAEGEAPVQFVHADDVAAAVDLARRARLDGPFNVAPEGWLRGDEVRALVGGSPRLPLRAGLARRISALGWRYGLAPTPPGFVEFVTHPWVVASDRLRAEGWTPESTNEEAFVAGHAAPPWATISPRRRQELALGVSGVALLGGVVAGAAALRRRLG